ncbi:MAG: HAD family hydrolase [Christensenellales bacterium]
MKDRIILLDLGGVLIEVVSAQRLYTLAQGAIDYDEIAERWAKSRYLRLFESGLCSRDEFARGIMKELRLEETGLSADEFMAEFDLFLKGFYPGAEKLLKVLAISGLTLACLTDTNPSQWESLRKRTRIDKHFEHCFLSYEIGRRKPDALVYRHVTDALGVSPEEILYFDDREENVRAGEQAGMKSFRVEGVGGLRKRLNSLCLL